MELDVLWEFLGDSRLFFYLYAAGLIAVVGKILKNFLTLKEGWIFRILFCLYVVMVTVMVIFAGDEVNILGALCLALGGAAVLFRDPWRNRLSVGLLFFVQAVSISALADKIFEPHLWMEPAWEYVLIPQDLFRLLLWTAVWLVLRRQFTGRQLQIPGNVWILIDILAGMPAAVILLIFMTVDPYGSQTVPAYEGFIYGSMGIAVFTSAALFYLTLVLNRNEQLKEEQRLWEMRRMHYEDLEREQLALRRMRHDTANHLRALAGLEGEQAREYLQEWMESPAMRPSRRFSENEVVNTVICSKLEEMERLGISWKIEAPLPEQLSMGKMEICSLFANALDNALEACGQVEEGKRWIRLKAGYTRGLLMLKLENSMKEAPELENGKLKTRKREKDSHGIGYGEIADICARYQGVSRVSWKEGAFTLLCSVPLQNAGKTECKFC